MYIVTVGSQGGARNDPPFLLIMKQQVYYGKSLKCIMGECIIHGDSSKMHVNTMLLEGGACRQLL